MALSTCGSSSTVKMTGLAMFQLPYFDGCNTREFTLSK
jgi:hypothetical protein